MDICDKPGRIACFEIGDDVLFDGGGVVLVGDVDAEVDVAKFVEIYCGVKVEDDAFVDESLDSILDHVFCKPDFVAELVEGLFGIKVKMVEDFSVFDIKLHGVLCTYYVL